VAPDPPVDALAQAPRAEGLGQRGRRPVLVAGGQQQRGLGHGQPHGGVTGFRPQHGGGLVEQRAGAVDVAELAADAAVGREQHGQVLGHVHGPDPPDQVLEPGDDLVDLAEHPLGQEPHPLDGEDEVGVRDRREPVEHRDRRLGVAGSGQDVGPHPLAHGVPGLVERAGDDTVQLGERGLVVAPQVGDDRPPEGGRRPGERVAVGRQLEHPGGEIGQLGQVLAPPGQPADVGDGDQLAVDVTVLLEPGRGLPQQRDGLGRRHQRRPQRCGQLPARRRPDAVGAGGQPPLDLAGRGSGARDAGRP
jgi:hypothetical protein